MTDRRGRWDVTAEAEAAAAIVSGIASPHGYDATKRTDLLAALQNQLRARVGGKAQLLGPHERDDIRIVALLIAETMDELRDEVITMGMLWPGIGGDLRDKRLGPLHGSAHKRRTKGALQL